MTRHRLQTGGTSGAAVSAGSPALHGSAPERSARTWPLIWMTSSTDHREHAIAEEELVAGHWQRSGIYRAICGSVVTSAALTTPPGRRCQHCATQPPDPRPQRRNRRRRVAIHRNGPKGGLATPFRALLPQPLNPDEGAPTHVQHRAGILVCA